MEEMQLRYFYGETYYTVESEVEIPLYSCTSEISYVKKYPVVKYHPDTFGLLHLQGSGIRSVRMNKIAVTIPPTLKKNVAIVGLRHRVAEGAAFTFGETTIRYRVISGFTRGITTYVKFQRLDREPITQSELSKYNTTKQIRLLHVM